MLYYSTGTDGFFTLGLTKGLCLCTVHISAGPFHTGPNVFREGMLYDIYCIYSFTPLAVLNRAVLFTYRVE